jgi:hypothetical protein
MANFRTIRSHWFHACLFASRWYLGRCVRTPFRKSISTSSDRLLNCTPENFYFSGCNHSTFFAVRSSTIECICHPTPLKKAMTQQKHISRMCLLCTGNFNKINYLICRYIICWWFYTLQSLTNHRANACSCYIQLLNPTTISVCIHTYSLWENIILHWSTYICTCVLVVVLQTTNKNHWVASHWLPMVMKKAN